MSSEFVSAPTDPTSTERLAATGLRYELVDATPDGGFRAWWDAVGRGFLGSRDTVEQIEQQRGYFARRRMVGVFDDSAADAASPLATVASWPADLTVPGHASVRAWAISDVTVAPTHRRRGVATQLLEGELRTAAALGLPVAMLTVSESTIYGRFGFGVAALARTLTVETKRARWIGPTAPGRVHFVTAEQLLTEGLALVERTRLATPGHISYDGALWERQVGLLVGDEKAKGLRFVRYDDVDGVAQGFAIYRLDEDGPDFTKNKLTVNYLVGATVEASAGLWRFLLEHDLVATVTASLRPIDEPLRWMVADFRAVTTSDIDHLWARILDVPAALEARRYAGEGRVVIAVTDPLGFAAGTWVIAVADGRATVTAVGETPDGAGDDAPVATLTAAALASIYLGTVTASTLAVAGRITGETATLDALFASPVAPSLDIWF